MHLHFNEFTEAKKFKYFGEPGPSKTDLSQPSYRQPSLVLGFVKGQGSLPASQVYGTPEIISNRQVGFYYGNDKGGLILSMPYSDFKVGVKKMNKHKP